MINLSGTRVVITGAGGGIGSTMCDTFSAAGAEVVGQESVRHDVDGI